MANYIWKRILMMIPVLLGVSLFIFVLMDLAPGNPALQVLGEDADPQAIAAFNAEHGLDKPLPVQWLNYISGILTRFDFGTSYRTGKPVWNDIAARYPTTALVAVLGVGLTALIGITTGIISAIRQYTAWDTMATVFGMIGVSMPSFFTGLVLIYCFSQKLGWLPASGNFGWKYYILPTLTISLTSCARVMRMTRSSMLEVQRQDYIRTARAKGQEERKVVLHHQLKNALIPIINVIGTQIGVHLGGSMIVEQIFSIPGIGKLMVDSIGYRDYPMIRACVLLIAFTFSLVNLGIDIVYAAADPRIYAAFSGGKNRAAGKEAGK